MSVTRREAVPWTCPACDTRQYAEFTVILDTTADETALAALGRGDLHEAVCEGCAEATTVPTGLLAVRPYQPYLMYFAPPHTTVFVDHTEERRLQRFLGNVRSDVAHFPLSMAPIMLGVAGRDSSGSFEVKSVGFGVEPRVLAEVVAQMGTLGDTRGDDEGTTKAEQLADHALTLVTRETSPQAREMIRITLAGALLNRTKPTPWDVERAIGVLSEAFVKDFGPHTVPGVLASAHSELARAYARRVCGRPDLNERLARRHGELAVELFERSGDRIGWAISASNLALDLMATNTSERTMSIERAIELLERAVEVAPPGFREWCDIASNLGQAYAARATGDDMVNFAKARHWYAQVADAEGIDDHPRGYGDTNYKLGMLTLKRHGDPEEALTYLQEARRGYERAGYGQLSSVYLGMSNAYAMLGRHTDQIAALEKAQEFRNRDLSPVGWARVHAALAQARMDTGSLTSLADAAVALREALEALELGKASPLELALVHNHLVDVWRARHALGEPGARSQQVAELTMAADLGRDNASWHWMVAQHLGELHAESGDWPAAAEAYRRAVASADELFETMLLNASQQRLLASSAKLRHEACYALTQAGRMPEAVVMAESARARIIGQALAQTNADLDDVKATHPEAYHAFADAVARFAAASSLNRDLAADGGSDVQVRALQLSTELTQAREALGKAIARIQGLPGQSQFLRTADFGEITTLTGPFRALSYVVATRFGSVALLVTNEPGRGPMATAVLDDVTVTDVTDAAGAHTDPADAAMAGVRRIGGLMEKLAAAMHPRIAHLDLIACGQLGLLPVHQAGLGPAHVAYALSAQTLLRARDTPARLRSVLAVGDPLGDIEAAAGEARAVAELAEQPTLLVREDAKLAEVLRRLHEERFDIVHLACHGTYDDGGPLSSGLELADGRLTLRALLDDRARPLLRTWLVVMSACESAVVGTDNPDEALGLPAAMAQAGAAVVVGSLWRVDDIATQALMIRFHELLRADSGARVNQALTGAQRWLAEATPAQLREKLTMSPRTRARLDLFDDDERPFGDPRYWAAFIAIGR